MRHSLLRRNDIKVVWLRNDEKKIYLCSLE